MRKTVAALVLLAAMVGLSAGAPPATASTKWLCKPGLAENPCAESIATVSVRPDGSTAPLRPARKRRRPVDCFYVYPTVSLQQTPNADLTVDPEVREIAVQQTGQLSRECRVFAPVYRQFTVRAITADLITEEVDDIAYADVKSAFAEYLKKYNKGRGIILVGHSQGTGHLGRLIRETVDRKPNLRKRLVSAMLIGGNVYVPRGKRVGGQFQNIPTCRTAVETGCLIAFSSFTSPPPADAIFGRIGGALSTPGIDPDKYEVACVNPAALDGSKGALKSFYSTNPFPGLYGLLLPDLSAWGSPWISVTGQYRASCRKEDGAHWLQFDFIGGEDDVRPRITEPLGRTWGSHLTEVNDASGNLTSVAASEIRSYLKKQKAASKKR
mgnify:FL=1